MTDQNLLIVALILIGVSLVLLASLLLMTYFSNDDPDSFPKEDLVGSDLDDYDLFLGDPLALHSTKKASDKEDKSSPTIFE